MKPFEVLLISIDWESPNRFRSIIQSQKYLEASEEHGNHSEFDIVLYEKENNQYFQFAIKTKLSPAICDNQRTWKNENLLFNIHEDLWIIKGDWRIGQRGIGYHHCPSVNTIGKIEIGISENLQQIKYHVTIDINSNIEDFDFEELKSDFEGELWNLITSDKSKVSTDKVEIRYSDRTFRYAESKSILDFLSSFDKIEKSPKVELVQTQILQKKEKVIPVKDTFRKLLNPSSSKLLPSKAVKENINVYENQYVCYMLHCIHEIITNNVKFTAKQISRLMIERRNLCDKVVLLEDEDPKADKEILKHDIDVLETSVSQLQKYWKDLSESLNCDDSAKCETYNIKIVKLDNKHRNYFWCKILKETCLVQFPETLTNKIDNNSYTFQAVLVEKENYIHNGDTYRTYVVRNIKKVWPLELIDQMKTLEVKKSNYNKLKSNNWSQKSILSDIEVLRLEQDRMNQVQTIAMKIKKLSSQIDKLEQFSQEHSNLLPEIEKRMNGTLVRKIGSLKKNKFKPSMTFIQNISYRNALSNYNEILNSEGIDIQVFDLFENVTTYGVREIPQIYEVWCLVKLINILNHNYDFTYNKEDIKAILDIFKSNKSDNSKHIEIVFKNNLAGRRITLHYQKSLENSKRPDFILEIAGKTKTVNLVLDSKFKNFSYKQSIVYETMRMVEKYKETENSVFILHPCKNTTTYGKQSSFTNYGGESVQIQDIKGELSINPCHEFGYIELKPNTTNNLKKLLGLGLEYLIDKNHNAKKLGSSTIDPIPENDVFCINCGGTDVTTVQQTRNGNRHYYSSYCNNNKCKHTFSFDYCWNCKTKLFKHGRLWDYHLESSWNAFDIHCPSCHLTMADRPAFEKWG